MDLHFYLPQPALREWINNIMIHRVDFDHSKPKPIFPFPPFPEQSLFFYPSDSISIHRPGENGESKVPAAIVGGPTSDRINLRFGYCHQVIKVSFQPGGLHRMLGIPMQSLLGKDAMDARDIWGNQISLILEQLSEADSFPNMVDTIERFLLSKSTKLKQLLPIDSAMQLLVKAGGLMPIDQLAAASCLSNRQFERVFKDRIGLSPKFFSRLVRFSRAWFIKENQPDIGWLQLANKCGYHDQMHFIRDFKEFTGQNPTEIESALRAIPVKLKNGVYY
jgi:AraC-like DNA-binding protein